MPELFRLASAVLRRPRTYWRRGTAVNLPQMTEDNANEMHTGFSRSPQFDGASTVQIVAARPTIELTGTTPKYLPSTDLGCGFVTKISPSPRMRQLANRAASARTRVAFARRPDLNAINNNAETLPVNGLGGKRQDTFNEGDASRKVAATGKKGCKRLRGHHEHEIIDHGPLRRLQPVEPAARQSR